METFFFIKAKKFEAFLPSLMKILEVGSEDEKVKIVMIFQNVLGHLKKSKTSSIALALVGKIMPLFDSVRLMWEPEPHRQALPHSPALKAALRAGSALQEWILGFAAQRCLCPLCNLSPEHRPHSHGQGDPKAHPSSFPAGVQPAARALPLSPQRPAEVRGDEG